MSFNIVEVDNIDQIEFADGPIKDACGRLRVSNPKTLFDSKRIYDKQVLLWDEKKIGNADVVYNANHASVDLSVTTTNGDRAIVQTWEYFNYQPAKSLLISLTGVFDTGKANTKQRLGYFDDDNGLFFEVDSNGIGVVKRSKTTGSVVDTRVSQTNWNIDVMDGSGISGLTLDYTKGQIFVIDFEWLSLGRVRFGFYIDGKIFYVHDFSHANQISTPFMSTPNLPIRYEVENEGVAVSGSTLKAISSSVIVEAGYDPLGAIRSVGTGISLTPVTSSTSRKAIVSIRLRSAYNRAQIIPLGLFAASGSGDGVYLELIGGGTLTGTPSWSNVDALSIVEYDTSADNVTGGIVIMSEYLTGDSRISGSIRDILEKSILKILSDIDGNSRILTLAARKLGSNVNIAGGLSWKEIY